MFLISTIVTLIIGVFGFCFLLYLMTLTSGWLRYTILALDLASALMISMLASNLLYGNQYTLWTAAIENFGYTLSILSVGAMFGSLLAFPFISKLIEKNYQAKIENEYRDDLTARKSARLEGKMAEFYGKLAKLNDIKLEIERKEKDLEQRELLLKDKNKKLDHQSNPADIAKIESLNRALSIAKERNKKMENHRIYSAGFARFCKEDLGMHKEQIDSLKRQFLEDHQRKQQTGNEDTESLESL